MTDDNSNDLEFKCAQISAGVREFEEKYDAFKRDFDTILKGLVTQLGTSVRNGFCF